MPIFIHDSADVQSKKIGRRTSIWQFSVVLPGAKIGEDCNVCSHCFIENDVTIGDRVTIKCGVQLWDGINVSDDVFIGPNVTFSNDKKPRSKIYPEEFLKTSIEAGASIGAGAVILPGINIGAKAMIGAGAVVTKSVPPNAIVTGNPGRIQGYVNTHTSNTDITNAEKLVLEKCSVSGVSLFQMPLVHDLRGNLSVGEVQQHIPFPIERYFVIFDVPSTEVRGEHAHKECHQFLVCLKGQCNVMVDDGVNRHEYILDKTNIGIHLPPMTWGVQYKYSADALLLVFASHHYDSDDYIRDYTEFLKLSKKQ